jgi:hypothetical protein
MNKTRLIVAIVSGAVLGLITEYITRPVIEEPLKEKVTSVVTGDSNSK